MNMKLEILMWVPGLFFLFPFYVWFSFDEASTSKNYLEEMIKTKLKVEKVLFAHSLYTTFQLVVFVYLLSAVVR